MATGDVRELAERFERFAAQECERSPLYRWIARGIATDPDLLQLAMHGDHDPKPNLFLAAVHDLLLAGAEHPLARHYPTVSGEPPRDDDPLPDFRNFALDHDAEIREIMASRYAQTNEIGRAAILAPGFHTIKSESDHRPLALVEIGASAGLLLNWDRYRLSYGGGTQAGPPDSSLEVRCEMRGNGRPPDLSRELDIAMRIGIDLNPIDVRDDREVRWLQALVWPDQVDRFARLAAATRITQVHPLTLIAGDAIDQLPGALENCPPEAALVVFHCHTLNQFPAESRVRLDNLLAEFSANGPLFRLSLEGIDVERDGRMDLVHYREGRITSRKMLARYDPHGAWIEWLAKRRS